MKVGIITFKFSCIEIRAFIIVSVAERENLQYFHTEMFCTCVTFIHTSFHRQFR